MDENLVFIESMMVQTDAPADLIAGGHASANLDYGPRGPQYRNGVHREQNARYSAQNCQYETLREKL